MAQRTAPRLFHVFDSVEVRLLICTKKRVANDPQMLHTNTSGQRGCMKDIVSIMVLLCMSSSPILPLYNHCNIQRRHKLPTWKKMNEWTSIIYEMMRTNIDSVQSFLWLDKYKLWYWKTMTVCVCVWVFLKQTSELCDLAYRRWQQSASVWLLLHLQGFIFTQPDLNNLTQTYLYL